MVSEQDGSSMTESLEDISDSASLVTIFQLLETCLPSTYLGKWGRWGCKSGVGDISRVRMGCGGHTAYKRGNLLVCLQVGCTSRASPGIETERASAG